MTDKPLNRRDLAKAATAAKVLKAARDYFIAEGWDGATIREIARRAGMSTGAVFANYEDKAELFTAAMGHRPITQEQGLEAMRLVRAMTVDLDGQCGSEAGDILAAHGVLRNAAEQLLTLVDFPALPDSIPDADHNPLTTVMTCAIEARV